MTNLSNQDTNNNDDFAIGDSVVFKSFDDEGLYFVVGYKLLGMLNGEICIQKSTVHTTDTRRVHESHLRHATTAEKIAKRRLPAPVTLFISPQVEFYQPPLPEQVAILDMGEGNNLSCHISPLCQVLNKSYMTDVINHLVRAHKAQREVS